MNSVFGIGKTLAGLRFIEIAIVTVFLISFLPENINVHFLHFVAILVNSSFFVKFAI